MRESGWIASGTILWVLYLISILQNHNECNICNSIIVVTNSEFLDPEHTYGYGNSLGRHSHIITFGFRHKCA